MTNQHHNDVVLQFLFDSVAQRVAQIQNHQGVQFEQFARQQQDRIDQLEDALRESHLERQRLEEGERDLRLWIDCLENNADDSTMREAKHDFDTRRQQHSKTFAEAIAPQASAHRLPPHPVPCEHEWISSEGRTASGVLCRKCSDYNGPAVAPVEPTPEDANHRD